MIEYALDNMPEGLILTEGFTYQPKFALGYTEAPRGEDIHWSMHKVIARNCSAGAAVRGHLRQPAGAALHAAGQYRFRCAADYRQP